VAFGLENLRYPRPVMRQKVGQALLMVGLAHKEEARLDQLSGGEKQKVALASVLAMDPQLLVFDAPTTNLDPVAAHDFYALLGRLKQETGKSMLIVEQQLDEVMTLTDRLLLLDPNGRLVGNGSITTVLAHLPPAVLARYGIWTPQVWELAEAARQQGVPISTYPLTVAEAHRQLQPFLNGGASPSSFPAAVSDRRAELPQEQETVLKVNDLSYTYPGAGLPALRQVNLRLQAGDFCAMVGQNGAGKTTLVKTVTKILPPPADTVFLGGEDAARVPLDEVARRVGYVFQNPEHQFVAGTVFDEVAYSLRLQGVHEAVVRTEVERMMAHYRLGDVAKAHPFSLSQGQKRLLSIAAVLITGPDVLILDEPTLGLDRTAAVTVMESLRQLNQEGTTILFISHDMRLTADYAHSVIVMAAGAVIYQGAPRALFARPEVMAQAALIAPPVVRLGWQIRQHKPERPLAITVSEFRQQITVD
jgi:energy-coupling factor transport system ATP-binding protein